jgi:hypothetical protein
MCPLTFVSGFLSGTVNSSHPEADTGYPACVHSVYFQGHIDSSQSPRLLLLGGGRRELIPCTGQAWRVWVGVCFWNLPSEIQELVNKSPSFLALYGSILSVFHSVSESPHWGYTIYWLFFLCLNSPLLHSHWWDHLSNKVQWPSVYAGSTSLWFNIFKERKLLLYSYIQTFFLLLLFKQHDIKLLT